jgi:DNA-binding CsgD family transcriptional regulator
MNATMLRAETAAPVLETWFEAGRRARLIVDDDLVLQWCNGAARSLLERRDPLLLSALALRTGNAGCNRRLQEFVRGAGRAISILCLPDAAGEDHLLISAVRLQQGGTVGLTAFFASGGIDCQWADLREAFGLTACEREIAQALASGHTAEAVAQKLQTSVKTVRTHIRHVYSKLGVSSREELFHKLTPYMIAE